MNRVNYDCRSGDIIKADWDDTGTARNARVVNTFPNCIEIEIGTCDRIRDTGPNDVSMWRYADLLEMKAVFVAKLIPIGPDGRLLLG